MSGQLVKTSEKLNQNSELKPQGDNGNNVPTKVSTMWSRLKRFGRAVLGRPALVVSLSVTGLLLFDRTGIPNLVRPTNLLEPLELSSYDRLIQLRPALPPDPRLLVVKVTEADIQSYGFPLKDAVLNELLGKLEQYQPAVIGLDIYRDIPVEPGHAELSKRLQSSDRIIPVCKISDVDNPGTPPPPGVPESRVGFADMAVDNNGVVRRGLLFGFPPRTSRCTSQLSFSFQLAQHYLEQKGIQAEKTQQQYLKLGKVLFKPLLPTDGGYQDGDNGGYQILLNYRTPNTTDHPLAQSATLSDILSNRIDPSLVKDHIVMIGVTAPSIDDAFYTPYSSGQRIQKMAGVVVHGQIVSQLLSTVLDGRPQLWFSPDWGEVLWIWVWSLTGGILVRIVRHPGQLVLAEGVALSLLLGTSVVVFLASGWLPVAAPTLGLIATGTGVLGYSLYEAQLLSRRAEEERRKAEEERQRIEEKAKEQEKNIEDLQALLKERSYNPPTTERESPLTEQTELPAEGDTAIATPQDFQESQIGKGESNGNPHILDGRYKISRILGSGGFGQTYLAQDNHRPGAPLCVVKHLKPARRDVKFLQVARRLFKTEAEILEKLGQHPQIPQLLAYFEQTQEFYLVQEYIQGHPLSDELPTDKRLPEIQVIKLLKGVLEILMFIHEHSVIHRDIKPSNIMRRELDGQLVLIDFGAVKQIQPQEQADKEGFTVAIGTRGYAPPEQYAGHPSFSSDIYALGMIGIQALTGIATHQLPFSGETGELNWRHLANVSEEFAQILDKMVRYHFAARYQSAAGVMEALQQIMN